MLVRGPNNFKGTGTTAFLYVGDTCHPIETIWNTGLAIGAYKVPEALFIQERTANVGIGTATPTSGILNTVANSKSVVGLSTVGWNAPAGSNLSATDAIHATGGNGDLTDISCCPERWRRRVRHRRVRLWWSRRRRRDRHGRHQRQSGRIRRYCPGRGTGGPTCFAGVGVVATGWRYGLRNGITAAGVHQAISPRLEYLPRADSGRSPIALV
jgi:hypothetical protein